MLSLTVMNTIAIGSVQKTVIKKPETKIVINVLKKNPQYKDILDGIDRNEWNYNIDDVVNKPNDSVFNMILELFSHKDKINDQKKEEILQLLKGIKTYYNDYLLL